jgi:hypothetical protein
MAAAERSTSAKYSASRTIPCLATSASPERNSRSEGADEVFGPRVIDGGLPADGRVDLRQNRGRKLHEVHATHVGGGHEPGQVADGPASQREHGGRPIEAGREQAVPAAFGHRERLRGLAFGHVHDGHGEAGALEALRHRRAVQLHDGRIGDECGP